MPNKRESVAQLAKRYGVTTVAIRKQASRHGLKPDESGRYSLVDFEQARKAGAEMDKRNLEKTLPEAEYDTLTLPQKKVAKQIEKLDVEISAAEANLRKMMGELADVSEISQRFVSLMTDFANKIDAWKQAEETKRPKNRAEIEALCKTLKKELHHAVEAAAEW